MNRVPTQRQMVLSRFASGYVGGRGVRSANVQRTYLRKLWQCIVHVQASSQDTGKGQEAEAEVGQCSEVVPPAQRGPGEFLKIIVYFKGKSSFLGSFQS